MMINIPVFAHKVNIFAYVEGDKVYTESYFNDGKKCVDSKIEVFDNQENKLLEGITNENGEFSFKTPQEEGNLKIVLIASMGHRAEYILESESLSEQNEISVPVAEVVEAEDNKKEETLSTEIPPINLKEIQLLIEESLDKKLEPILREIKRSQEHKISPTEIIGGIGYIIGIFGIIAYFLSRKR